MVQRLDALSPRPKRDGSTFWVRIGTAWRAKQSEGYDLTLDALPLADKEGRVFVALREPKDDNRKPAAQETYNDAPLSEQLNDAVPF